MYKNLNTSLLNITGRQSEIIELALTYGFRGINIDMFDLVKRVQRTSFEAAARFLLSSKLSIGGFEAPIDLDADETAFASQIAQLPALAEVAGRIDAQAAQIVIPTGTDRLPYPEYFEVIRKRVDQIAEVFGKEGVKLAIGFSAIPEGEKQFKFVRDVDGFLVLLKACSSKNVFVVFDSWNWHLGGGTVEHLDRIDLNRIAVVQLSDCREGVDRAVATCDDSILPGSSGVIDNGIYLSKIAALGNNLPVSAFGKPQNGTELRDAYVSLTQDALDAAFSEAGLPSNPRKPETFAAQEYASN